jgi:hypothetical protein
VLHDLLLLLLLLLPPLLQAGGVCLAGDTQVDDQLPRLHRDR